MHNLSYILVNHDAMMFTHLNRFNSKSKQFQGEYSIIHNDFSEDNVFLNKFLLTYIHSPLYLLNNNDKEYLNVINNYSRFLENDIAKHIEEKIQTHIFKEKDLEMEKNLGQLQLSILKKMIEKQLETVRNQSATTQAEHQVLLGKELSLQWVLHTLEDIVEKGK